MALIPVTGVEKVEELEDIYFKALQFSNRLPKGFTFKYTSDRTPDSKKIEYQVVGEKKALCLDMTPFDNIQKIDTIKETSLYVPSSPWFPVIDAFMFTTEKLFEVKPLVVSLFQVTQGKRHFIEGAHSRHQKQG